MHHDKSGIAAGALYLQAEVRAGRMKRLARTKMGLMTLEMKLGRDSLWAFIRGPGNGGYALRTAHAPSGLDVAEAHTGSDQLVFRLIGATGAQEVRIEVIDHGPPLVRATTILTPNDDLLLFTASGQPTGNLAKALGMLRPLMDSACPNIQRALGYMLLHGTGEHHDEYEGKRLLRFVDERLSFF